MVEKRICDICNKNEASRSFKVKQSLKGYYEKTSHSLRWVRKWSAYEKIDICGECGEKLLGLTYRDENGLGIRPPKKQED